MRNAVVVLAVAVVLIAGCQKESEDSVISVAPDDAQMNAAMAHARETVREFIKRLRNPEPNDSAFSVKMKIEDGDEVEHFWLDSLSYNDGVFTGTLGNEPVSVRNVKYGQKMEVQPSEISDWMYLDNGKMVGNFTLLVLLDHMSPDEAKAIREQFQIDDDGDN